MIKQNSDVYSARGVVFGYYLSWPVTHNPIRNLSGYFTGWTAPLGITILILYFIIYPSFLHAHPGATDKDGCHKVSKDYKYTTSQKVLKAGTEHCHAGLDKVKFDGKQVLEDPPKKEKGKK